jgi:hypothetical protein
MIIRGRGRRDRDKWGAEQAMQHRCRQGLIDIDRKKKMKLVMQGLNYYRERRFLWIDRTHVEQITKAGLLLYYSLDNVG